MKKYIKSKIEKYKKSSLTYKLLLMIFVFLIITITATAWICDDAYISFRVVDNFINGYGLRWNTFERVQVFTNPLLVLCMSILSFFTREVYYTSILFSIVISSIAIYILLFKISKNYLISIGIGLVLMLSNSFISFTTSGLENCLIFLLLALFSYYFFKNEEYDQKNILILTLISSFILINRMDTILLIIPCLIYIYFFKRDKSISLKKVILLGILGMTPFLLWEIFCLIYYGFPFPNTAYAKLGTNIAIIEYVKRGIKYYFANLFFDPITLLSIVVVVIYVIVIKKSKKIIPVLGILLFLIYIVRVGGDFMNGRFFTGPFFFSLIILSSIDENINYKNSFIIIFIALLVFQNIMLQTYENGITNDIESRLTKGVINERGFYFFATALRYNLFNKTISTFYWYQDGLDLKLTNTNFAQRGSIGIVGYYAGPKVKILDSLALSDPLLVRMPIRDNNQDWRIGHIYRTIPNGYVETIETGINVIEDKNIKKYYDKLKIITQDKLFTKKRFKTIINMNLGKYDYLIK